MGQDVSDLTDPNKTSDWTVCVNTAYPMGLYVDEVQMIVNQSVISYTVSKCRNSTENNNFCASEDEINDIMKYVLVQASIPKSVFDFNNPINPRKRTYQYQLYHLDTGLMKYLTGQLSPIFLKTDHGLISDDYSLDSVDFNLENLASEAMFRKNENTVLKYDLVFGCMRQTYYRKNQKIYVFLANFGGVVNLIFIVGKLLCQFYNNFVLKHHLINMAFNNLDNRVMQ